MKYFRYAAATRMHPSEFWYDEGRDASVDWQRIRDTYQIRADHETVLPRPNSPAGAHSCAERHSQNC